MNREISKDGRCGRGIGYYKKGECCSKYDDVEKQINIVWWKKDANLKFI